MSTFLQYGSATFNLVEVSFRAMAVYDEVGHTLQGHQMTFRVSAYVIGGSGGAGSLQTRANFQTELRDVLDQLSKPRQKFLWVQGSQKVFEFDPASTSEGSGKQNNDDSFEDRRFGPHPRVIDVKQIPGGLSANISFEVEVFTNLCGRGEDLSNVEEFWWRFSYTYDRDFNCTRNVSGKFRLRSALNAAEEFLTNSSIWPRIPNGFYRENQDVNVSIDNLLVTFSVTDKQVWRTLPRPLTDGTATFRIEQRMAQLFKTLNCSFSAPVDVSKNTIMNFIDTLIRFRFPNAFVVPESPTDDRKPTEWFTNFTITNYEFENRIDVSVTSVGSAASLTTGTRANGIFQPSALALKLFPDIQGVVDPNPNDPNSFLQSDGKSEIRSGLGTAGLIPENYTPWRVCGESKQRPGAADTQYEQIKDTSIIKTERQDSNAPQSSDIDSDDGDTNPATSEQHQEATYTSYYETWRFINVHNVRVLPVVAAKEQDILQQTTRPQCRIVCTGAATRISEPPQIPSPAVIEDNDARVDYEEIGVDAPYLMADGQTLAYKAKWHYSVVSPNIRRLIDRCNTGNAVSSCVQFPINPLYSREVNEEIQSQNITHILEPITQDGDYDPPGV